MAKMKENKYVIDYATKIDSERQLRETTMRQKQKDDIMMSKINFLKITDI